MAKTTISFRKRIKLMDFLTLNIGKTGMSLTLGKPGMSLNINKHGAHANVGLPGTGISTRTRIK